MFSGLLFRRPLGVVCCAISIKFVVNAKDGSSQKQELRNDRTVASSDLVRVADGQRSERERDCSSERGTCNDIFSSTCFWHSR